MKVAISLHVIDRPGMNAWDTNLGLTTNKQQ
jgi:hypothetical protein